MRQGNLLSDNMLTDEVTINFNVLRPFMKDRIISNSGSTGIVPMKRCRTTNTDAEFTEKTAEPDDFSTGGRHRPIFGLSGRLGHSGLLLALPRDERVAKKHTPASGRSPRIRATSPVGIGICG